MDEIKFRNWKLFQVWVYLGLIYGGLIPPKDTVSDYRYQV